MFYLAPLPVNPKDNELLKIIVICNPHFGFGLES